MKLQTFERVSVSLSRESCGSYRSRKAVKGAADVADLCHELIGREPRENMLAVYLDAKFRVLAVHTVSIGTVASATIHPREFFTPAFLLNAYAVIACHNHPSGDPTPSIEDREVTERLRKAGELLGFEVLDHVIIGQGRYYTFAEARFHALECMDDDKKDSA